MRSNPHKIIYADRISGPLLALSPEKDIGKMRHTSMGSRRRPDAFIWPVPRTGLDATVKFQLMRFAPFSGLFFAMRNPMAVQGSRGR